MNNPQSSINDAQPSAADPQQISALLASNPEAAHFLADLAAGTPLADAARDHFGDIISPAAAPTPPASSDVSDRSDRSDKSDRSDTSEKAPEPPAPQPAMYQPIGTAAQADVGDVDDPTDFLPLNRRINFWGDDEINL